MNSPRSILVSSIAALLAFAVVRSDAALVSYSADANTIQLWHLDEAAGGSSAAALGTLSGSGFTVDNNPNLAAPPLVTTVLGATEFSGFGNAANISAADLLLGFDRNASGAFQADAGGAALSADAVTLSTLGIGGTNPFTLEAMVNFTGSTGNREIISTDSSAGSRGFQFRLNTSQQLEFNLISGGGGAKMIDVPTIGPNAFATGAWFHAEVAYDGANITFYWTKVDAAVTSANSISTQALAISAGSGAFAGPLTFGNENRNVSGEGLLGMIDEIRISNIARSATGFLFTVIPGGSFWNLDANGNWDIAGNWTAGVPNAVSAEASLGGGGTVITAPRTITLDGTKTLGKLNFSNATQGFTLVSGTAGALALDYGANAPTVTVAAGAHTVSVPVSLPAAGATFSMSGLADKLTLTDTITGAGSVTVSGAGTLEIGSGGATGALNAAPVIVSSGTLAFNRSDSITVANDISGGGTVKQSGGATLTLTGNNSFGAVAASAGTVKIGRATALPATAGVVLTGGNLDLNGNASTIASLSGSGGTLSDSSAAAGTTSLIVNQAASTIFGGTIANGANGRVLAFTKTGNGELVLTAAQTYTGPIAVFGGTLTAAAVGGIAIPNSVAFGNGTLANIFLGMGAANQFAPGAVITWNNGAGNAKFELRGFDQTIAGLSSDADDVLSIVQNQEAGTPATATLTIDNANDYIFNGLIRTRVGGPLNLVKKGIGTQEIRNLAVQADNFGTLTINGGKFVINFNGVTGTLGAGTTVAVAAPGILGLDGTWEMNRAISGTGKVVKQGTGAVIISGAQSYAVLETTGGTTTLTTSLPNAEIDNTGGILNVNADATGSTVNVSGTTNFGASQTLAALNIAAGGVVTLGAPGPAPGEAAFATDFDLAGIPAQGVPEPCVAALMLGGLGVLVGARRRRG